jgi:uncharacterized membrane protein YedE/YeeE
MGKRKAMAGLLIVMLAGQSFTTAAQMRQENKAKIKEQAAAFPVGTKIEVKPMPEGSKRIVGRLVSITDEAFEVQTEQSGKVSTEKIAFADVKSVKKSGMRRLYKVLIIVGGVLVGIGIALAASGRSLSN